MISSTFHIIFSSLLATPAEKQLKSYKAAKLSLRVLVHQSAQSGGGRAGRGGEGRGGGGVSALPRAQE